MDKVIFNIDTRFRNNNLYPDPEHFVIELYEAQKNIDYIRITSIEIPNMYYVFSSEHKTNFFKIKDNDGSWVNITIPAGYYTIDSLISQINTDISSTFANNLFTVSSTNYNNIIIRRKTCGNFYLDFNNDSVYKSLGYRLGFRKNTYTVNDSLTSESVADIKGESYCFLRINDYGNFHLNPFSGTKALYKLTIDEDKTNLNFENGSDLINKTHFFRQPVNLKRLEIELLDTYGNRLNNRGIDYSLTIEMGQIYNNNEYNKKLNNSLS